MPAAGQIALVRFPNTDLTQGKLRPVLLVAAVPGNHDDWLVCMVSSQLHQEIKEFDDHITSDDADFRASGLKVPSLFRIGRIAVVQTDTLVGALGHIAPERLGQIRARLSTWLAPAP